MHSEHQVHFYVDVSGGRQFDHYRLSIPLEAIRTDLSHLLALTSPGTSLLKESRLACPCTQAKTCLHPDIGGARVLQNGRQYMPIASPL